MSIHKQGPFIQNRRLFYTGLFSILLLILFNIRYPGPHSWIEALLDFLGLPLYSQPQTRTGFHYASIPSIVTLLTGLICMNYAVTRHRLLIFVGAIIVLNSVPGWLTGAYQRLFASGIYALQLDPRQVKCTFKPDQGMLTGQCELLVKNHSRSEVEAHASLQVPRFYSDSLGGLTIELPPQKLQPKIYTSYAAEFRVPVREESSMGQGQLSGLDITLSDGKHNRIWRP